jgi:hypothetical protein
MTVLLKGSAKISQKSGIQKLPSKNLKKVNVYLKKVARTLLFCPVFTVFLLLKRCKIKKKKTWFLYLKVPGILDRL